MGSLFTSLTEPVWLFGMSLFVSVSWQGLHQGTRGPGDTEIIGHTLSLGHLARVYWLCSLMGP